MDLQLETYICALHACVRSGSFVSVWTAINNVRYSSDRDLFTDRCANPADALVRLLSKPGPRNSTQALCGDIHLGLRLGGVGPNLLPKTLK